MATNIGMMDSAYFVGRNEILQWINARLQLKLSKIEEVTDLKLSVDLLETERDYYFGKLRDIEILCQDPQVENFPMAVAVKKILYATDERETALAEAQEILSESVVAEDGVDDEHVEEEETSEAEDLIAVQG